MVIVSVQLYILVLLLIFQTALLVYQKLAQFASIRDKRASIIELHHVRRDEIKFL